MTADDRTSSASNLSPATGPVPSGAAGSHPGTQSATFELGDVRIELTASPGAARVVVSDARARDVYVVDPSALADWSRAIHQLLALAPAATDRDGAEYRSPFLIDREGRASIAVEARVGAVVSYRVIVHGAESRVAGIMATHDTARGPAAAAASAVGVAASS